MNEDIIMDKLEKDGFKLIASHEPNVKELDCDNNGNYPVEYADYVYEHGNKIVIISIDRCLHPEYKSNNIRITKWIQEA